MLPLSPRICQCMRRFFIKRPKFLAATSNLGVEQNLVHLGRFFHFSHKMVGVTLNTPSSSETGDQSYEKETLLFLLLACVKIFVVGLVILLALQHKFLDFWAKFELSA